jgi:hypothetical protein
MQYSGKNWEAATWGGGIHSGYDMDRTIYTLNNYSPAEAPVSSVYAFEPTISEVEISLDDLASFLPASKPAADLTMTMAG